MLGLRFRQVVQSVASTSSRPVAQQIHTSSVLSAARKQSSSVIRKQNIRKQVKRAEAALADRPSVVLGTRPSEEAVKWPSCMLAKILVDEDSLIRGEAIEPVQLPVGTVEMPKQLAFGVGEAEKELLFGQLPEISAQAALWPTSYAIGTARGVVDSHKFEMAQQAELKKAHNLAKVVDLRNTNAAGLAFENRRRIILAFSTPENTFDTGRPEVQAALKTYEIRKLYKHLITFKRDVGNRLGLRKLVHKRAKILRYLRDMNRDRYETILENLALEPEAVEGELVV